MHETVALLVFTHFVDKIHYRSIIPQERVQRGRDRVITAEARAADKF